MCTYVYTPYRGCAKGQQHFYLQWMKCNKARENGNRHCPLRDSVEVEELKKLSGNVLFCPLDNPIAVQQHEFLFIADDEEEVFPKKSSLAGESRARSRSVRSARGRPNTMYKVDRSSENSVGDDRVRKTARKKIPRDLSPPPTPHSDSSDSPIPRPRTASGVKRLDDEKVLEDRRALAHTRSHRRANSVEFAPLPTMKVTPPAPSEVTRPHPRHAEDDNIPGADEKISKRSVPPGPLSPGMRARLGLPPCPDIHRRNSSIQRSRSESPMRAEFQFAPGADGPATDPEFGHPLYPQPDTSPEPNPEPFAVQPIVRRSKTTRSRAAAEERMMRRIEEDKRAEEELTTRLMPTPKREVKMTLPDHHQEYQADQAIGLGLAQFSTEGTGRRLTRAKSEARIARSKSPADLKVDVVPLPERRKKYIRDDSPNLGAMASKVPSASPPEPQPQAQRGPIPDNAPSSYVDKSVRSSRTAPDSDDHHDETTTAAFHQKREARKSRCYEEQVAEAKKWALARDQHFCSSVPSLPTAAAAYDKNLMPHQSPPEPAWSGARESNDSGYLSGHHHNQQHQGKSQRRNTLHKPHPSTGTAVSVALSEGSTFDMDVMNLQSQREYHEQQQMKTTIAGTVNKKEAIHVTAVPMPMPMALSVGPAQGEGPSGTIPGQGKASLLKRMGLKRKISSLWERNRGAPNGAAAVAG